MTNDNTIEFDRPEVVEVSSAGTCVQAVELTLDELDQVGGGQASYFWL
ncbi:MAG TPA: hypothetical protein VFS42_11850 [Burkholderiaceae bacterium]|nr:hypothetical protein [Burkholderiaceae bacterium]